MGQEAVKGNLWPEAPHLDMCAVGLRYLPGWHMECRWVLKSNVSSSVTQSGQWWRMHHASPPHSATVVAVTCISCPWHNHQQHNPSPPLHLCFCILCRRTHEQSPSSPARGYTDRSPPHPQRLVTLHCPDCESERSGTQDQAAIVLVDASTDTHRTEAGRTRLHGEEARRSGKAREQEQRKRIRD